MLQLTRIPGYNGRFVNISPSENPSEDLVEDFVEYYIFDLTLTDEDTNSILTDNTNRAIQGNVAMQMAQPGGQVCNLCKWRHLMANIRTNASDLVETKMM